MTLSHLLTAFSLLHHFGELINGSPLKCVAIDAHNSVEKQHDDIQGMIDGQFDAILASALDMGNLTSLYAQAKKQGIITASLAQNIPHSDLYYRELL